MQSSELGKGPSKNEHQIRSDKGKIFRFDYLKILNVLCKILTYKQI